MDASLIDKLVSWLKKSVEETNSKGVIVAASGGVDSAVVSHLAKLAFPDNSLAVWIGIDSSRNSKRNMLRLVSDLKIENEVYDLTEEWLLISKKVLNYKDVYKDKETYDDRLENQETKVENEIVYDNLKYEELLSITNMKARLRSNLVYSIANMKNYLVLGTTNRDENYIGYFTKWGDMGADLYPLLKFSKKEVYQLAKLLKVNQRIVETPPTADLYKGQKSDEEELDFKYQDVDDYLNNKEIDKKKKQLIEERHKKTLHKQLPFKVKYFDYEN